MRDNIVVLVLASVVCAIPTPQLEDYGFLREAVPLGPAVTALSQRVTYIPNPTVYDTVTCDHWCPLSNGVNTYI